MSPVSRAKPGEGSCTAPAEAGRRSSAATWAQNARQWQHMAEQGGLLGLLARRRQGVHDPVLPRPAAQHAQDHGNSFGQQGASDL